MEIRADMRIVSDKDLFAIGTVTLGGILRIQNVKVLMLQREGEALRTIVVLPRKKQKDGTWKEIIRIKDPVLWKLIKEQVLAATREAADRWLQMKEPEEIRIQLCSGGKVNAYAAMQYEGIEIDGIQITEVAQGVRVLFPYDFPEGRIVGLVEAATPDIRKSFVSLITARYEEEKAKARHGPERADQKREVVR